MNGKVVSRHFGGRRRRTDDFVISSNQGDNCLMDSSNCRMDSSNCRLDSSVDRLSHSEESRIVTLDRRILSQELPLTYVEGEYLYPKDCSSRDASSTNHCPVVVKEGCSTTTYIREDIELPPSGNGLREVCSIRSVVARVLESETVPKIIITSVSVVLFYVVVKLSMLLLNVEMLTNIDYVNTINLEVNQTNGYLADDSRHFNEITMNVYSAQMRSELLSLQGLLDYFNAGVRLNKI